MNTRKPFYFWITTFFSLLFSLGVFLTLSFVWANLSPVLARGVDTRATWVGEKPSLPSGPDILKVKVEVATSTFGDAFTLDGIGGADFRDGNGNATFFSNPSPQQPISKFLPGDQGWVSIGEFETQVKNDTGNCLTDIAGQIKIRSFISPSDSSISVNPSMEVSYNAINIGAMFNLNIYKSDSSAAAGASVTISPADSDPNGGGYTADSFGQVLGIHRYNCTLNHTVSVSLGSESKTITLNSSFSTSEPFICNGQAKNFTVTLSPPAATPTPTPTPPPPTPTPTPTPPPGETHAANLSRSVPGCSDSLYSASFSWSNSGSGWWIDVTTDSSFGSYWNKEVSGMTATTWGNLSPNTTYYWRIWDTYDHHLGQSFSVLTCTGPTPTPGATPTPTPTPTPPPPGSATLDIFCASSTTWQVNWSSPSGGQLYVYELNPSVGIWQWIRNEAVGPSGSWTGAANSSYQYKSAFWPTGLSAIERGPVQCGGVATPPPTPPPPATYTINVYSSPVNGATVAVPGGDGGGGDRTTPHTWTSSSPMGGWFVAKGLSGYTFSSWSGCDSTSGPDWCDVKASAGNPTRTIIANYSGGPTPPPPPPGDWWVDLQFVECTRFFDATLKVVYHLPSSGGEIKFYKDGVDLYPTQKYIYSNDSSFSWTRKKDGFYQIDLYIPDVASGSYVMSDTETVDCVAEPTPPPPTPTPTPSPSPTLPPPPPPPTAPSNLTVSTICNVSNQPQVTFTWTDSTGETGYWLDVNVAAWTGPSSPSPWGVKTLGANVTSFVWSLASGLDSGIPTVPASNTTYWWRLKAFNTGGESSHIYPPNSLTPPGTSVTTPNCVPPPPPPALDLKARFVKPFTKQVFNQNDDATVTVRVSNVGDLAYGGGSGVLGFWPKGGPSAPADADTCTPTSPPATPPITFSTGTTGNAGNLPVMSPGSFVDVTVTFNVGTTSGVANAFVLWNCSAHGDDVYWPNNHTSGSVNVANPNDVDAPVPSDPPGTVISAGDFVYTVNMPPAWFETQGGDVGASGNITVAVGPAAGRYQSEFLIAGKTLDTDLTTAAGWKLANYNKPLIPSGGTYNFLADRFLEKAKKNPASGIENLADGLWYINGDATFNGVGTEPTGNVVIFVEGDLHMNPANGEFALGTDDTVAFIVKGNINIEGTVTRLDGIYVTDGTFDSGNVVGKQLVVNGGVYAKQLSLVRVLASTNCGLIPAADCDNAKNPAEVAVYDPKYIIGFSSILGSASYSWREVAP